jgi:hypothetical protein
MGPKSGSPRPWKLYGALALAALLAGLLIWQILGNAQTKRHFKAERANVAATHKVELADQAKQLLRTSGALLGSAIRTPLEAENFEAIEGIIKVLVQEKQIEVVAVADRSDTIRISTNHKLEGQALTEAFPDLPEGLAVVVTEQRGTLVVSVPVAQTGQPIGRAVIAFTLRN